MNHDQQQWLRALVARQQAGEPCGIYAVCSAHEYVLESSFGRALVDGSPLLIEATCNQVNQYGGYTGQTPRQFAQHLLTLAKRFDFPQERLILGGDHLGPSPWQDEPAVAAMERAHRLVYDCVAAGYQKIHLDASMPLGDDPRRLDPAVSAGRAADLAATAERAFAEQGRGSAPLYVIGTEVPLPGGMQGAEEGLDVSHPADVEETINLMERALAKRGPEAAWERVIAIVVQPGVEYGDRELHAYDPQKAATLSSLIETYEHLVYEAHSTDYQTAEALRALVRDHFAILKVGPALTFAFREGVFALSLIEEAWLGEKVALADVPQALEEAMLANRQHWQRYYRGDAREQRFARKYSFSDRSRYYWPEATVQAALQQLLANIGGRPLPLALLSQYLPDQYRRVREGVVANEAQALLRDKISAVLFDYAYACGYVTAKEATGPSSPR